MEQSLNNKDKISLKELNLFDYFVFPDREKREKIYKENTFLNTSRLRIEGINSIRVSNWVNEFNNKVSVYKISYLMLMHYFKMDIPETSNRKTKEETKESKEKMIYKYYFNYFAEIFLCQIERCFEMLYQCINVICSLEINYDDRYLISKVKNKIEKKYPNLYNILRELEQNQEYNRIKKLRNTLVHSYTPLREHMLEYFHSDNSVNLGSNVEIKTSEMLKLINNAIEILDNFKNKIQQEIENDKLIIREINEYF